MAFAANDSKPKTISKTRAGSSRTVELKGPLPKAMNIGDGTAKKYDLMGRGLWPWGWRRLFGKAAKRQSSGSEAAGLTTEPSPCQDRAAHATSCAQ